MSSSLIRSAWIKKKKEPLVNSPAVPPSREALLRPSCPRPRPPHALPPSLCRSGRAQLHLPTSASHCLPVTSLNYSQQHISHHHLSNDYHYHTSIKVSRGASHDFGELKKEKKLKKEGGGSFIQVLDLGARLKYRSGRIYTLSSITTSLRKILLAAAFKTTFKKKTPKNILPAMKNFHKSTFTSKRSIFPGCSQHV